LDEIIAFMLVLFFTATGWQWSLWLSRCFRFFDIVKPEPIRHFDNNWHGGLGVMFDDLLRPVTRCCVWLGAQRIALMRCLLGVALLCASRPSTERNQCKSLGMLPRGFQH